jgi:hypothetical protein
MVGHLPLEQVIGVRIPGGQPKFFPTVLCRPKLSLEASVEGVGGLRLRIAFALRTEYFAQDDRVIEFADG